MLPSFFLIDCYSFLMKLLRHTLIKTIFNPIFNMYCPFLSILFLESRKVSCGRLTYGYDYKGYYFECLISWVRVLFQTLGKY